MSTEPTLPKPWPTSFDEINGVWTITGDDAGSAFPLAVIRCHCDDHNGGRRHAAHLMANTEATYDFIASRADRGDSDAIQAAMTASDAEERAIGPGCDLSCAPEIRQGYRTGARVLGAFDARDLHHDSAGEWRHPR